MPYLFDSVIITDLIMGVTNPIRKSIRLASTTNIDTATFISGSMMDGISVSIDDRILLKNQTDTKENGVYRVQESDALVRTDDFYDNELIGGYILLVQAGDTNGSRIFVCNNTQGNDVVATDSLTFSKYCTSDANTTPVNNNFASWQDGQLVDSGIVATAGGSTPNANFSVLTTVANVNSSSTATVAYFNYDHSLYSSFASTGTCTFYTASPTTNLNVVVHDGTVSLGGITVAASSSAGSYSFNFTRPSSNKLLQAQGRNTGINILGTNISAMQYRF